MRLITFGNVNLNYYFKNDLVVGVMPSGVALDVLINLNKEFECYYMGCISRRCINLLNRTNVNFEYASIADKDNKMFIDDNNFSNVCPYCNRFQNNNYEFDIDNLKNINGDDIIIYDSINNIFDLDNKAVLILNNYNDLINFSLDEIINLLNNKFLLIVLSLNVYHFIKDKFNIDSVDLYDLLNLEVLIIFRGKYGCDVIVDDNIYEKEVENPIEEIEKSGGLSAFSAPFVKMILSEEEINEKIISKYFMIANNNYVRCILTYGSTSLITLNSIKNYYQCICNEIEL